MSDQTVTPGLSFNPNMTLDHLTTFGTSDSVSARELIYSSLLVIGVVLFAFGHARLVFATH